MKKTKKVLVIVLVLSLVFAVSAPSMAAPESMSYHDGEIDGRDDADRQHSSLAWGAGGLAGGFLLGLIGGGIVVGGSRLYEPSVPSQKIYEIEEFSSEYRSGYRDGYASTAKNINTRSAAIGAGVGTAAFLVIFLTATN